jgi:hypothetical protein
MVSGEANPHTSSIVDYAGEVSWPKSSPVLEKLPVKRLREMLMVNCAG